MPAQYAALLIHKVARLQRHLAVLTQKAHIIPVRHEANILTVRLVRVAQSRPAGAVTDGRLVIFAHRQQQVGQLVLRQLIQHIALILAAVAAPQQQIALRCLVKSHTGIVPCGKIVIAQRQGPVQQCAELQAAVAVDARIGRASGAVFRYKAVHHLTLKSLRFIKHIELHAQAIRHTACILCIVCAAAASLRLAPVQPQHGAVTLIAFLLQQQRRRAAVHTAGHGDQYFFLFHDKPLHNIGKVGSNCQRKINPYFFAGRIDKTVHPPTPPNVAGNRRDSQIPGDRAVAPRHCAHRAGKPSRRCPVP